MRRRNSILLLLLAGALLGGSWLIGERGAGRADPLAAGLRPGGPAGARPADAVAQTAERPGADAPAEGARRAGVDAAELAGAAGAAGAERQGEAGPRVVGRVVGPDRAPREGAVVHLREADFWLSLPADLEPVAALGDSRPGHSAKTDAEGLFAVEGVEPGTYDLAVRAAGCAPLDRARLRIPEHERHDLGQLALTAGITVEGRVVDGAGRGLAGVTVLRALSPQAGSMRLEVPGFGAPVAESGPEGEFRVDTLAPGGWHLIFEAPAHRVAEALGTTEPAGEVHRGLLVTLEAGLAIGGRVEDPDAALDGPLRVRARCSDEQPSAGGEAVRGAERHRPRTTAPAPDGSFLIGGLAPGVQYLVELQRWVPAEPDEDESAEGPPPAVESEATGPGRWRVVPGVESELAMAGALDVVLRSRDEASLSFSAVDAVSGEPVARFHAALDGSGLRGGGLLKGEDEAPLEQHPGGAARFGDLHPRERGAEVRLRIVAEGREPFERAQIQLRPGEDKDLGAIELRPAPVLGVRVVDSGSGAPVAGARVLLAPAAKPAPIGEYLDLDREREPRTDPRVRFALTDESGLARVTAFPGTSCVLRAIAEGRVASEEVRSHPPHGTELELALLPAGRVLVKVLDTGGQPLAGIFVEHRAQEAEGGGRQGWMPGRSQRQTSDERGEVRFEGLSAGEHTFWAVDGVGASPWGRSRVPEEGSEVVRLDQGGSEELELRLPARGAYRAVLLEAGDPLAGALARVRPTAGGSRNRFAWLGGGRRDPAVSISDYEGRVAFEGLPVGRYVLSVTHPERRMAFETEVELVELPLEERLELGVPTVEGRVVGERGEPLEGLRVAVQETRRDRRTRTSDFRITIVEDDDGDTGYDWDEVGQRTAETDSDGRYVLRGVRPDEPLGLRVTGEHVVTGNLELDPLSRDEVRTGVDFQLDAAGCLEIQLTGVPQGSRQGFDLNLVRQGEGPRARSSGRVNGWRARREFCSLRPGMWRVEVRRAREKEVVATGEAEVVTLESRTLRISVP